MDRTQLANAMLKGKQSEGVEESQTAYVASSKRHGICRACALGCALIGKYGGDYHEAESIYRKHCKPRSTVQAIFANLLDIPVSLAVEVEFRHMNDQSIEDIAAWLKSSE